MSNEDAPENGQELLVPLWRLQSAPDIHVEYDRPPGCIHMICGFVIKGSERVQHSRQPVSRVRNQATQMCPRCLDGMEHNLKHFGVLDPTEIPNAEEHDR